MLLSASFDFTVCVWSLDGGLWSAEAVLGEMSGNKFAYFGAMFLDKSCKEILAYTYNGAFHRWLKNTEKTAEPVAEPGEERIESEVGRVAHWRKERTLTGHFGEVSDLSWDSTGRFLFSGS